ncbi:MAG: hypothetical protein RL095_3242 [Verrucomicrobiota bacterium]|jgi:AraC family L-rhamnose operon regulatory protein RhaS
MNYPRSEAGSPAASFPRTPDFSLQVADQSEGRIIYHWIGHPPHPGLPLAPDELPGITTMGMWSATHPQPLHAKANRPFPIQELQLTLHESSGVVMEDAAGRATRLEPRSLVIALPGDANTNRGLRGNGYWINIDVGGGAEDVQAATWHWPPWVVLTPADRESLKSLLQGQVGSPVWEAPPEMRETFHRLGRAVRSREQGEAFATSLLAALLNFLLIQLLRMLQAGRPGKPTTGCLTAAVQEHWERLSRDARALAAPPDFERMAAVCDVTPHAFHKATCEISGETPARHLLALRLARAATLLRETNRPVLDIGRECGFSSSQYFATCFKKRYKYTPREWREQV